MKHKINSFWKRNRESEPKPVGLSVTVPGLAISMADIISGGLLDKVGEAVKKRNVYGERKTISDLSELDGFRRQINLYKNLIRKQSESIEVTREENEGPDQKITGKKAVKNQQEMELKTE